MGRGGEVVKGGWGLMGSGLELCEVPLKVVRCDRTGWRWWVGWSVPEVPPAWLGLAWPGGGGRGLLVAGVVGGARHIPGQG